MRVGKTPVDAAAGLNTPTEFAASPWTPPAARAVAPVTSRRRAPTSRPTAEPVAPAASGRVPGHVTARLVTSRLAEAGRGHGAGGALGVAQRRRTRAGQEYVLEFGKSLKISTWTGLPHAARRGPGAGKAHSSGGLLDCIVPTGYLGRSYCYGRRYG